MRGKSGLDVNEGAKVEGEVLRAESQMLKQLVKGVNDVFPASQLVQEAWPASGENFPVVQRMHGVVGTVCGGTGAVTVCPVRGRALPAAQSVQLLLLAIEYVPAEQIAHAVAVGAEYKPAEHELQAELEPTLTE